MAAAHRPDRLDGHAFDVSQSMDDRTPPPAEPLRALVAQVRGGEIPGGLGVREQVAAVQRADLAVESQREVRDDRVHVQLWVEVA